MYHVYWVIWVTEFLSIPESKVGTASQWSTLEETWSKHKPLETKLPLYKKITQAIAEFIVIDMRPISIVEGRGFQALVKTLEPRYQNFPSRANLTDNYITPMYYTMKQKVHSVLILLKS